MTQNLRLRGRSPGRIVNTAGQVVVHVSKNVLYYRFTSESLDSALTWNEEEDDIRQNARVNLFSGYERSEEQLPRRMRRRRIRR